MQITIGETVIETTSRIARIAGEILWEFHGAEDTDGYLSVLVMRHMACTVEEYTKGDALVDKIVDALQKVQGP